MNIMEVPETYYYIALRNREGGNKVLKNAGYYYEPQSPEEMALMFREYVNIDGDKAISELANIHPDNFMFQPQLQLKCADAPTDNSFLNCEGCTKCTNKTLSADGITVDPNKELTVKNYNTLIIAGASVLVLSMIALIIIKK